MNSNKKTTANNPIMIWVPLMLAAAVSLGIFAGWKLQQSNRQSSLISKIDSEVVITQGRIEEILRYIDLKYVNQTNRDSLEAKVVNTILNELDPFSVYLPASKVSAIKSITEASYEGLGMEWAIYQDTPVVTRVIAESPAAMAGIQPGDQLISVNDTASTGANALPMMQYMRGPLNHSVSLEVLKMVNNQTKKLKLHYQMIKIPVIDAAMMVDDSTGYIRINRFSTHTYGAFMEALEPLIEKQKMKNLILDLRQNPGGLLQEAANLLSQMFEDKGKLLVYTEGRFYRRNEYRSTGHPFFSIGKIAVLIDEGTASASEVIAGAIQDYDRGTIIGRNSYGKGLVQEQYPLSNGAAIRLTVARYFTPSGRLIQRNFKHKEDYDLYFQTRLANGDLFRPDSNQIEKAKKYYTALGREVYELDGIRPDIFVPLDSIYINPLFRRSIQAMPGFVLDYYLLHKNTLPPTHDALISDAKLRDDLFKAFETQVSSVGALLKSKPSQKAKLSNELIANLAAQMFGKSAYYQALMPDDEMVKTALKQF
ncbi:MAG: S41 family peptidase [Saprospiraceae bacterium]